jgi:hypothetical protein
MTWSSLPYSFRVVLRWFPLAAERRSPSEYERLTAAHECDVEEELDRILFRNEIRLRHYTIQYHNSHKEKAS